MPAWLNTFRVATLDSGDARMVVKLEFIVLIFTIIWLCMSTLLNLYWHIFLGRMVKTYEFTNLCVDVFKYHFQVSKMSSDLGSTLMVSKLLVWILLECFSFLSLSLILVVLDFCFEFFRISPLRGHQL